MKYELRSIAKKRTISDYKYMCKNELINANKISKPRQTNKKNNFKSKRKEIKESFMKFSTKKILKSKIKEIKKILYQPIKNLQSTSVFQRILKRLILYILLVIA